MYSNFLLLFAPVALILLIVAVLKDEKKSVWQMLKKYIPCGIIMLLCLSLSVSAATNTTKTAITTITEKAEGKVYIAWSKKSVDGYQVRWALNDRMTGAKTASITKNNATRSGLIGGRTYYFQVRTYKSDGEKKVYSGWSAMKSIKLKKNDVVVFSSSPIPGNEKVISQIVNRLYEKEVDVVLASAMDVHVSGHASSEELKLIHTLMRCVSCGIKITACKNSVACL